MSELGKGVAVLKQWRRADPLRRKSLQYHGPPKLMQTEIFQKRLAISRDFFRSYPDGSRSCSSSVPRGSLEISRYCSRCLKVMIASESLIDDSLTRALALDLEKYRFPHLQSFFSSLYDLRMEEESDELILSSMEP